MEEYETFDIKVTKRERFEFLLQVSVFLIKTYPTFIKTPHKEDSLFSPSKTESTPVRQPVFVF